MTGKWRKRFKDTCNQFHITMPPEDLCKYFEEMGLLPAQAAFLQLARTFTKPLMKRTERGEEFEGCCFFLNYNGLKIISAAHVLEVNDTQLFTWLNKEELLGLSGDLFKNKTTNREEDVIDMGIFCPSDEMLSDLSSSEHVKIAPLNYLESTSSKEGKYCLIGYPATKHDIKQVKHNKVWAFNDYPYLLTEVSDECYNTLESLGIKKDTHLVFEWKNKQWQPRHFQYNKSVKLKGFSGSPIWNLNNGKIAGVFSTQLEKEELKAKCNIEINCPKIIFGLRSKVYLQEMKKHM